MQMQIQSEIQSSIREIQSSMEIDGILPINLVSESIIRGNDDSKRISQTYEESNLWYKRYEDTDNKDPYEQYDTLAMDLVETVLHTINKSLQHPMHQIKTNENHLFLAANQDNDSLFIQITDHTYYITITLSGQY